jgi:hypothetical protein
MNLELTDDKERALVQFLRRTLDFDPFPLAPRLDPLRAILAKLEPPALRHRNHHRRCRLVRGRVGRG